MPMKTTLLVCFFLVAAVPVMDNPKKECRSHFLKEELTEIEGYIAFRDSLNPAVSKVEVAWHLDHSLRTINEIHKAVKKSNPENYKGRINLGRTVLLLINKIPRGRAESPKIVTPPEVIHTDSLYGQLALARKNLVAYDSLPKKAFFEHPHLGIMDRKTSKKFLEIHTEHHLKIIRDILKK